MVKVSKVQLNPRGVTLSLDLQDCLRYATFLSAGLCHGCLCGRQWCKMCDWAYAWKMGQTRSDQRLLVDQDGGRSSVSQCLFIWCFPGIQIVLDLNCSWTNFILTSFIWRRKDSSLPVASPGERPGLSLTEISMCCVRKIVWEVGSITTVPYL